MSGGTDAGLPVFPEPLVAEGSLQGIRFSASTIERAPDECPAHIAINALEGVYAGTGRWRQRWPKPASFFQGTLFEILSEVENGADLDEALENYVFYASEDSEPIHPLVAAYMREAANRYLRFSLERNNNLALKVAQERVLMSKRKPQRTLKAWGRWYETEDGTYREFRRLRYNNAKEPNDARRRFAAAATKLLADGDPEGSRKRSAKAERVVVIEVGMLDGSTVELFDGTSEEARKLYEEICYPVTRELGDDVLVLKPGRECTQCKWRVSCPAVPKLRGILGLPGQAATTRDISASDLVQYEICPGSYIARIGYLPATDELGKSFAAERGKAVHQWLRAAHERGVRCSINDLPLPADGHDDPLGVLDGKQYVHAHAYLASHMENCVMDNLGISSLVNEPTIRVFDPDADVMVVASPDQTWKVPGDIPVWREIKTVPKLVPQDALALLRKWPQVALYLVMLAEGADAGTSVECSVHVAAVELELLTDSGALPIVRYETTDDWILTQARRVVAEAAYPWSQDTKFKVRPGGYCKNCHALTWCDGAESIGAGLASRNAESEVDTDDADLFTAIDEASDL